MVTGCGPTCSKYVLFGSNFILLVLGVSATGVGIYILVGDDELNILDALNVDETVESADAGHLKKGATIVIVVGVVLLVVGFIGCCGAIKESKCMLGTYAAIIGIVIIIEIAAAGLGIAFREKLVDLLQKKLKDKLLKDYEGPGSDNTFTKAMDYVQVTFECCGVEGAGDYENSEWQKQYKNMTVPPTCCELKDKEATLKDFQNFELVDDKCPFKSPSDDNPHTNIECYEELKDWILDRVGIIIGIPFAIVVVQGVALVFVFCLIVAI